MSVFKWPDRTEGKDMWIKLGKEIEGLKVGKPSLRAAPVMKAQGIPSYAPFPTNQKLTPRN
jgi:hypothetical protein